MNCRKKYTPLIALLIVLLMSLNAWTQSHLSPSRMGFHRAEVPAPIEAQLLMDRLRVALEKRDAAMPADLFAADYHEVESPKDGAVATAIISRDAMVAAMALFHRGETQPLHFKWNTVAGNNAELQINFQAKRFISAEAPAVEHEVFLKLGRNGQRWRIIESSGLYKVLARSVAEAQEVAASLNIDDYVLLDKTATLQKTMIRRPVAEHMGIDRLTRQVSEQRLGKRLFSLPADATLFARVEQFSTPPYYSGTYVQLVTDPGWNRIVYGDYQKSIKAYYGGVAEGKLNRPMGIDRDSRGFVYVADTGNNRIVVLQIIGANHDVSLRYFTSFGNGELSLPYDVAWDDRGTPFDNIDDMLWVVEQGQRRVSGYRMQLSGVQKIAEYTDAKGFERLTSVAVGRFNGISTGELYVSDAATKSVVRLHFDGAALREISRYPGKAESQFESVGTDHWGNVYVTDRSLRQIIKLNNRLEELAILPAELEHDLTPLRFEPVFAAVALAQTGETFWSGYDQGFALEKWTGSSGAQRLELGIDVARLQVMLDETLSTVSIISRLTDAGELTLEILNDAGQTANSFPKVWQLAGDRTSLWERRDEQGRWVAPGYYRVRYSAASTYGTQLAESETSSFYLPLFYHEDCGSHPANDAHLAQGFRSNKYGEAASQTVAQDEQKVVYRFNDLSPALAYEVRAEYFSGEGSVTQRLTVDERELLAAQNVDMNATRSEWLNVPAKLFTDGEIQISIEKVGGSAPASISQLWLRQANFDPNNPPAREMNSAKLPREFELSQNFPNPFNPETTIEFSMPEGFSEAVELSIFNVMGQRVRTLVKGNLAAGRYAKVWNGSNDAGTRVASGVYFYRFTAGSFTQTRKLLLIK